MDPWAPINGISLERYAELSAEVEGAHDPARQAEIVGRLGVARGDWEAAKAGWTARMQDMSLMGQVATRYMPLYQAALARKSGGTPQVTFEDYVAMSGCVPVMGFEGMLAHYKLTSAQWTMISGHWNTVIPTNPQYMQFGLLVEQESARLRAGGPPKPVHIGGPANVAGAAPQPAYPQVQPPGHGGAPAYPQAGGRGYPAPAGYGQHPYISSSHQVGAQLGNAFNAFGNALGSFVDGAVGGFAIGARVMVQWSDGHRYPGTITNLHAGQLEVAFPDGRRVWVPQGYATTIW